MWFIYILRCADESFYVGETHDVATRLAAHNHRDAPRGGPDAAASREAVDTPRGRGRLDAVTLTCPHGTCGASLIVSERGYGLCHACRGWDVAV